MSEQSWITALLIIDSFSFTIIRMEADHIVETAHISDTHILDNTNDVQILPNAPSCGELDASE